MSDPTQLALQRTLAEPGNIKRVEQDDGSVRYESVVMLAPGEWTDAKSRTTFYYSPEGIANSVDNWADNNLHLNHDGQETVLADIGHVDADTVDVDDKGRMYGDIVFHRRTSTSKDAEELMKLAVETDGEQGLAGPSVEIVETKDEYDSDRGMDETTEMVFSGLGLVTSPASRTVAFEEQMKAMQADTPDGVRLMHNYKGSEYHGTTMEDFQARLTNLRRTLQSEDDLNKLKSAIDQFQSDADGGSLPELLDWAQENLSDDLAQLVANLAEEFAGTLDGNVEEADASDLMDWASEQLETDEDGEEEEGGEGEDNPDDEEEEEDDEETEQENGADDDLEAVKDRLATVEDALEAMPDAEALEALTELQGLSEDVSELSEAIDEIGRDLSDLQDEPVGRSLTAEGEADEGDDRVMVDGAARVDRDRVGKPGAL